MQKRGERERVRKEVNGFKKGYTSYTQEERLKTVQITAGKFK